MALFHDLNDDVLDEILRACSTPTISNLCLVSTKLYAMSLPHLLRNVKISHSPELLLCFLHFIIDNSTTARKDGTSDQLLPRLRILDPGRYVFSFQVQGDACENTRIVVSSTGDPRIIPLDPNPIALTAPFLTKAVALMPNLRSMAFRSNFEDLCYRSPQFAATLLSLPLLVDVKLDGIGPIASQSLGEAACLRTDGLKLKKVAFLSVDADEKYRVALNKSGGLGSLLFSCREYLEVLECEACNFREFFVGCQSMPRGVTGQMNSEAVFFPKVHSLTLFDCFINIEDIASYFPSLQTLDFDFVYYTPVSIRWPGNLKPPFEHLLSFTARGFRDVLSFLKCVERPPNLRRLVVRTSSADNDLDVDLALMRSFQDLKSLHVHPYSMYPGNAWHVVGPFFTSLSYLSFSLYLSPTDDPETLSVLNAQLLSSIPIAYISVTFKEEEQTLVSFEAVALVYAKSIKSLKYADVRKSSRFPSHQEQYWWKFIRIDASSEEDQGVGLETLNEREGIALRDRHDQLSFRNRMT